MYQTLLFPAEYNTVNVYAACKTKIKLERNIPASHHIITFERLILLIYHVNKIFKFITLP